MDIEESVIQGLMLLGRSREEAEKEARERQEAYERKRQAELDRAMWDYNPRRGF